MAEPGAAFSFSRFKSVEFSVRRSLEEVKKLAISEPFDASALHRGLFCISTSAVESFFTSMGIESTSSQLTEAAEEGRSEEVNQEYLSVISNLRKIAKAKRVPGYSLDFPDNRDYIVHNFSAVSFTSKEKFETLLEFCSGKIGVENFLRLAGEECKALSWESADIFERWSLVVDRRNQIIHEGDFKRLANTMRPIGRDDVEYAIEVANVLVGSAYRATTHIA